MSGKRILFDALKTFTYSLSQGLAAQGQAPGKRGGQMGMAAAIGAPLQLRELEEQRKIQEEDRAMKIEQMREAVRRGNLQDALAIRESLQRSVAPEMTVQNPTYQARPLPTSPQFPTGVTPPVQGGGSRQVAMPLPQVNIPGVGMVRPNSAQELARVAADAAGMRARAEAENTPPPVPQGFTLGPGNVRFGPDGKPIASVAPAPEKPPEDRTPLVNALLQSPDRYNDLPATLQAELIPDLMRKGFKFPQAKPGDPALAEMRRFTLENALRDDYRAEITPYQGKLDAYNLLESIKDEPAGGPNDIVLIYNFVKMQDPNAVKEGEIQLVQQGASIPDTWRRYAGQYLNGNVLGPAQRAQLLTTAKTLYEKGLRPSLEEINKRYTDAAKRMQVNEGFVRPLKGAAGQWKIVGEK